MDLVQQITHNLWISSPPTNPDAQLNKVKNDKRRKEKIKDFPISATTAVVGLHSIGQSGK
jgi:hypothetical protein